MPEDYLPELKEILGTALQQGPDVITKEFERLAQEARIIQVRAARLPQVAGNFNYGITETATASDLQSKTRDSGFFYNFGVSQALFHWFALRNQSASARLTLLVTEKSFAMVYRDLSVLLRKLYLALIVEKARVRHLRETLRLAQADLDVATYRQQSGAIASGTLESMRLGFRESTLEFTRADSEFTASRRRFARLAGLAELPAEKIPDDIPRPVYSEPATTAIAATLLRENAESTLEYEIYDLRVKDAKLRQKIEATRNLPKFGLGANYSLENTTNVNGNLAEQRAVTRQSLSIGGSWSFFDGLASRGVRREALAARRAAEHLKKVEVERMLQNAQYLERSLKLDAEQLDVTEIRGALAVENHRRIAAEFGFGNLPRGEVERAQASILQAQTVSLTMRAAYLSRWTEFVALAAGDPILQNLPGRYAHAKSSAGTWLKIALVVVVLAAGAIWASEHYRPLARVKLVNRALAVDAVTGSVLVTADGGYKDVRAEVSGKVVEAQSINKDSRFTKNAPLVQLDLTDINRALAELERDMQAKRDLWAIELKNREEEKLAEEEVATAQRLFEMGTASEVQRKTAERALETLRRSLRTAEFNRNKIEADYKVAKESLELQKAKMTVRAPPIDGVVQRPETFEGALIGATQTVAVVYSNARIVAARIGEESIGKIRVGQKARLRLLSIGGSLFNATVSKILPTADDAQRFEVWLTVDVADPSILMPGSTGEATITLDEHENALVIQRRSLFGGDKVWVVKDGRVTRRQVKVGFDSSLNVVEILEGLEVGDQVIVDRLEEFREGLRVKVEIVQ